MRRSVLALPALLLIGVAAPRIAQAETPWAAPISLPGYATGLGGTSSVDITTSALLTPGAASAEKRMRIGFATLGPGSSVRRSARLDGALVAGPTRASRQATIVRTRFAGRGRRDLEAASVTSGGSVIATQELAADWRGSEAAVAGPSGGARSDGAAIAWIEDGARGDHLRITKRLPDGRFAPPTTILGSGQLSDLDVALGHDGTLVVAAQRETRTDRRVVARVRPPDGSFGPVDDVGPSDGLVQLDATVAPDGRALVAYGTQDGGEEANRPDVIGVAVRPAAARSRFGPRQVLDRVPPAFSRLLGVVSVGADATGQAVVAWSATEQELDDAPTGLVRTATAGHGGRFRPAQDVAGLNGAVGPVVVTGGAVAVASQTTAEDDDRQPVLAAIRAPGARAFSVPEVVSDAASLGDGLNPTAPQLTVGRDGLVAAWDNHLATRPGSLTGG